MRPHRLILTTLLFACCWLSFGVLGLFAFEDGSVLSSKRCECDSVELWLPRRTNGAPKLLYYEDIVSNDVVHVQPKSNLGRGLRLWIPKHCELKLDDGIVLQKDVKINNQNRTYQLVEVWIKNDNSENCLAASVRCNLRSLCVGIETRTKDVVQFTGRKLFMYKTNSREETFSHKPYGILLSGLVFCLIIILVALCGKAQKNSHDSVAHYSTGDNSVEILSSGKIKANKKKVPNNEGEVVEIKVEDSSDLKTDTNSNSANTSGPDADPYSVIDEQIEVQKDVGESSEDGVGCSKVKRGGSVEEGRDNGKNEVKGGEIETRSKHRVKKDDIKRQKSQESEVNEGKKDKRKHEKKKDKDQERSRFGPEQKSSISKMRFSLKGSNSQAASTYDEPKVVKRTKKDSKKKADNGSPQPNPRAFMAENRRSFMNRELPKRPSEERDDPPAHNSYTDDTEDDNYETVVTKPAPPRSPVRLTVPTQDADDSGSDTYDCVLDTTAGKAKPAASLDSNADDAADMYETVQTKKSEPCGSSVIVNHTPTSCNPQLYESVPGVYEDPRVNRQRSFSERGPGSSTPRIDAERKTNSLRGERSRQSAPSLPPRDQESPDHATQGTLIDDIEPYTITFKKGDCIIQETSISGFTTPSKHGVPENEEDGELQQELSPEEKESLYTKVDKEKQKKDRMEAEMGETNEGAEIVEEEMNGEAEPTVTPPAVSVEEHQYEAMPQEKKTPVLEKKGSFEQTEDPSLYEEVVTKDDSKRQKVIAYV